MGACKLRAKSADAGKEISRIPKASNHSTRVLIVGLKETGNKDFIDVSGVVQKMKNIFTFQFLKFFLCPKTDLLDILLPANRKK